MIALAFELAASLAAIGGVTWAECRANKRHAALTDRELRGLPRLASGQGAA